MSNVSIAVKNVSKSFKDVHALKDVSFEVNEGEIFGFLGPNGAGKTTTIRVMMDFLRADEGTVTILGKDSKTYAESLKTEIGFLSGENNLYESWTGQEHIDVVKGLRGNDEYLDSIIQTLSFDPSKKVTTLSSGNKQKLGLILALIHQPKIIILDEPTNALDPILQNKIYEVLRMQADTGVTVFMSSHNLAEVERICHRVCIIKEGQIGTIETVSGLRSKRMYVVRVLFNGEFDAKQFNTNGFEVTEELSDGLHLNVKGEIQPLLKQLDTYDVKDLEISHASLENVFLEFYK